MEAKHGSLMIGCSTEPEVENAARRLEESAQALLDYVREVKSGARR